MSSKTVFDFPFINFSFIQLNQDTNDVSFIRNGKHILYREVPQSFVDLLIKIVVHFQNNLVGQVRLLEWGWSFNWSG